ncbi:MAG TPA: response regulator [Gemmatimonadaceae bacterium]|nr:response regulator [Gemmatimonadaceae bacterium]
MSHHVLLVEDSSLVTDALRTLFEQTGRRVSVAPTVSAAVEACVGDMPDLVLLDLTLPDGDGLSLFDELKSRGLTPTTVVAMTGHDDPRVRARCLEAGCREVLVKPVSIRELLRRVDAWVGV